MDDADSADEPAGGAVAVPGIEPRDGDDTQPSSFADLGEVFKIDDLARLTGITVDTIRFYQREGLLPEPSRQGRSNSYGLLHVRALERIKDLQAKHFSLGAIKRLAEEGKLGLVEVLFATDGPVGGDSGHGLGEEGDIDRSLVSDLAAAGLPGEVDAGGRCVNCDLPALAAAQKLLELGMPREVVLMLVSLSVRKFSELEKEVAAGLAGQYRTTLRQELEKLVSQNPEVLSSIVPLTEVIFRRVLSRSLHNIAQEAIETLAEAN